MNESIKVLDRTSLLFPYSVDLSQPEEYLNTLRKKYGKIKPKIEVNNELSNEINNEVNNEINNEMNNQLSLYEAEEANEGTVHPNWKLSKVLIGHKGWVRSVAIDPSNKFFVTGSADTTIKAWDLATGSLKLTLTSHLMAVRSVDISNRHPYLFSSGEDKSIKLWDLEKNTVIRDYHGHLSGVYSISVHPTLDVLISGSRDSSIKVWDIRTSIPIMTLQGHKQPITKVVTQPTDPQIVSSSQDKTIRFWDLRNSKTQTVLTHHRKAVRTLSLNPIEWSMASASADSIRQWKFPDGAYLASLNHSDEDKIVNSLSINQDNVLFVGGDEGEMTFYDWNSTKKFQTVQNPLVPGSLDSEGGILTSSFDLTGSRLIVGGRDKSVKIWQEE